MKESLVQNSAITALPTRLDSLDDEELADRLRQTEEAMEILDKSLRRYYDTAVEIVPQIVENETPMISFLRTVNYDPNKAAKRLAMYWKYRSDVFKERWLLPMVQTGRGALTLPDIALLNSGYFCFQPREGCQQGFVCLNYALANNVFAEAKAKGWSFEDMLERVNLYISTVCPDADSQTRGILLFYPVLPTQSPLLAFRSRMWDFIKNAAPVKLTGLLVPQAFDPNKGELLEFKRTQTAIVASFNSGMVAKEIRGHSTAQTRWNIENAGIGREYVPVWLGGTCCMEDKTAEWIRMRVSVEAMADTPRALVTLPKPSRKSSSAIAKRKRDEPESEKDFIRKRNAIYSRRMYHKRKLEVLSLQEEIKMWEDRNAAAREVSQKLENLLTQANACVACLEPSHRYTQLPYEMFPGGQHIASIPQPINLSQIGSTPQASVAYQHSIESPSVPDMGVPYLSFDEFMFS